MATKSKKGGDSARCPICKTRPKKSNCRGRCQACYRAAYRLVKAGKVTWEQLEKAGLVGVKQTRRSHFHEEVAKRLKISAA